MENYYDIEIKVCSKNGWSTPQEAMSIWGKYSREGVTIHWWGDGTGADNHDNITNYFMGQAAAGIKSVNYVVSDRKITMMVSPDMVAWCSTAGNPTTVSIEHQPTLGAEGYKRSGWLLWQLEERYAKRLSVYPHWHWNQTSCPGTINLDRIRAEADKWANGGYGPAPAPVPAPAPAPVVKIAYSKLPAPVRYLLNKDADLWNFNTATWGGFQSVKKFKKGDEFMMYGIADNLTVHAKYAMTAYSFGSADTTGAPKATNGVNIADLALATTPPPTPVPAPVPVPPPSQVEPPLPPAPVPIPTPLPTPTPVPVPTPTPTPTTDHATALKAAILAVLVAAGTAIGSFLAWLHNN